MDSSDAKLNQNKSMNNYSDKEFWNSRFTNEKKNDWYINWNEFKPYITSLNLDPSSKILNVGSGTSYVAIDMWKDGIKGVVNIDISDQAVTQMQQIADSMNVDSQWIEMDATQMTFQDEFFDIVFDKGTLDALVCAPTQEISKSMLREMYRVCKVGGLIYIVTHSCPQDRGEILDELFDPKKSEIDYCLQALSPQVNLVNIMRSKAQGKPLSEVIRDPALFLECMIEMKKDSQEASGLQMNWRSYPWNYTKKFNQQPEESAETVDSSLQVEQLSPEPEALQADAANNAVDVVETGEQKETPSDSLSQPLSFDKRTKFVPRQNYCFIYRIKKLSK